MVAAITRQPGDSHASHRRKGADASAKSKNGWTALEIAQEKGHKEIVELLKAHGAKDEVFRTFVSQWEEVHSAQV